MGNFSIQEVKEADRERRLQMKNKSKLESRVTEGHKRGARVHVLRGAGQEAFYTLRDASTRTRHGRAVAFRFVQDHL